jgi:hypothetical protein
MASEDKKAVKPLQPFGYKDAKTVRLTYHITPPEGTKPEDLLLPDFWVHVARQMRAGDRVEVLSLDRSWYLELIVLEVGRDGMGGARVAFIHGPVDLVNSETITQKEPYGVRWGGVEAQWQVVDLESGKTIKEHLPSKEVAQRWVKSHKMAMAA